MSVFQEAFFRQFEDEERKALEAIAIFLPEILSQEFGNVNLSDRLYGILYNFRDVGKSLTSEHSGLDNQIPLLVLQSIINLELMTTSEEKSKKLSRDQNRKSFVINGVLPPNKLNSRLWETWQKLQIVISVNFLGDLTLTKTEAWNIKLACQYYQIGDYKDQHTTHEKLAQQYYYGKGSIIRFIKSGLNTLEVLKEDFWKTRVLGSFEEVD